MQKDFSTDPDIFARKKSQQIWRRYLTESKLVAMWILSANFFFGVLPGILFFAANVRLSQEEDESLPNVLPNFNSAVNWFGIIFVLFPIFISVFQILVFHRLISLRMTRTFFVGQLVGFIFYMCAFSKSFLKKFHWFPKKSTFIGLAIILIVIIMIFVFLPYLLLYSEVVSYTMKKKQRSLSTDTIQSFQQQQYFSPHKSPRSKRVKFFHKEPDRIKTD